jgi:O-antigen/teichoic acid export membrane protein
MGIFNAILVARVLGPVSKGDYYLLLQPPATFMVLLQLGLPAAFSFHAARGQVRGVVAKALTLVAVLSLVAFILAWVLLPSLRRTFLPGLEPALIFFALCGVPLLLLSNFTSSILIARQAIRWYAAVSIAQSLGASFLFVLIVGVIGLGVTGAIAAFLMYSSIAAVGFLLGTRRVVASTSSPGPVTYRELLRYGLPLYPGSLSSYFSSRADVYLLAALLVDSAAAVGYYSLAVGLAEMVFLLPSSVNAVFFPHVAGSSRAESDRQAPMVSRVTLLLTAGTAVALAPLGTALVSILLPAFKPSLPALYVLLPGVVALSVNNVVSAYVAGLGLTAVMSVVNIAAFLLNIAMNLVLIPSFGIVGASAASLVSYTASSVATTFIAAHLARAPWLDFWIPRSSDLRFAATTLVQLARRMLGRSASR